MTRMTGCMGISLPGRSLGTAWILQTVQCAPMIPVIPDKKLSGWLLTGRLAVGAPGAALGQPSGPDGILPARESAVAGGTGAAGKVREASHGRTTGNNLLRVVHGRVPAGGADRRRGRNPG